MKKKLKRIPKKVFSSQDHFTFVIVTFRNVVYNFLMIFFFIIRLRHSATEIIKKQSSFKPASMHESVHK